MEPVEQYLTKDLEAFHCAFGHHDNHIDNVSSGIITPTYEMVDLGLSVKWATCNLGATKPEEYGNFYAWGETEGYDGSFTEKQFNWSDYKWTEDGGSTFTKYGTDGKLVLESSDDAVSAALGGNYRMPTKAECEELTGLTHVVETTDSGVKGVRFTASNSNSIFIPFAGYCVDDSHYNAGDYFYLWSSARYERDALSAWYLHGYSNGNAAMDILRRYDGFSVRPVCE